MIEGFYAPLTVLLEEPALVLVPVVFFAVSSWRRQCTRAKWAALAWAAVAAWGLVFPFVPGGIRFDLLLIYPPLMLVSMDAVLSALFGRDGARPPIA